MADFCKQCSLETLGEDFRDLAGLVEEGHCAIALCEGCGAALVDHEGRCIATDCLKQHGEEKNDGLQAPKQ